MKKRIEVFNAFNYDYSCLARTPEMSNNDYQKAIYKTLKAAEEKYQKTGVKSLVYIEDAETLINPKTNCASNIATMKNFMQCCNRNFHTKFFYALKSPETCHQDTMVCHRINEVFDLKKLGIAQNDVDFFNNYAENLKPVFDEVTEIYRKEMKERMDLSKEISILNIRKNAFLCEYERYFKSQDPDREKKLLEIIERFNKENSIADVAKITTKATEPVVQEVLETAIDAIKDSVKETANNAGDVVQKVAKTNAAIVKETNKSKLPLGVLVAGVAIAFCGAFAYFRSKKSDNDSQIQIADKISNPPLTLSKYLTGVEGFMKNNK